MCSGAIGIRCCLVVMFLGAASGFQEAAQAAPPAVGSGLATPTVTTPGQAEYNKAVGERARGQQLPAAGLYERWYDMARRYPTKCIEGQSFSVRSSWCPQIDGCYSESGHGRLPRVFGEFEYVSQNVAAGGAGDSTVNVLKLGTEGRHKHWTLAPRRGSLSCELPAVCTSPLYVGHPNHPSNGLWTCRLSGNKITPTTEEFGVFCGCPAYSQWTDFDKQAALQNEKRLKESLEKRWNPGQKRYSSHSGSDRVNPSVAIMVIIVLIAIRVEIRERNHIIVRSRASVLERLGISGWRCYALTSICALTTCNGIAVLCAHEHLRSKI
ncbi:unnamed protein product [Laminaria digitata]